MSLQQFLELADCREVFNFKLGLGAPALPNFGGSLQLMHTRLDLQQPDERSRRRPTSETSCLSVCLSVCFGTDMYSVMLVCCACLEKRHYGSTALNERSSRSHVIFRIVSTA